MATIITRTLLCLVFGLAFVGCQPQSQMRVTEWPYVKTNQVIAFQKITRTTPSGHVQTGISLSAKERLNYAIAYGNHSPRRNQVQPGTNTIVWLDEKGEYAFLTRGEMMQGASMGLGNIGHKQVMIHIEQMDGEFFRSTYTFNLQKKIAEEKADQAALNKLDKAEIEKLVLELRSSNLDPAPFGWGTGIPINYDLEAQMRVWRAQRNIRALGITAFPALVAHLEDKEYSDTEEYSELVSFSVGHVCHRLIAAQVNIAGAVHRFKDRKSQKTMYGGTFFNTALNDKHEGNVVKWWEANKQRNLEDIQLESIEWLITKEKELGFLSPEQEKKVLEPLEEIRQRLLKKIAYNAKR